jgi:hypothetical protein
MSMTDLIAWWSDTEKELGMVVRLEMNLIGLEPGKRLNVVARAYKPSCDAHEPHQYETRLSWPTASHKNVVNLMTYLVHQLVLQAEASEALDAFSPPG